MLARIHGEEKLESLFGRVTYTPFSKVVSLTFFEDSPFSSIDYSLALELETDHEGSNYKMKIKFTGVRQLQLQDFGNRPTQITGFDIVDISERHLESLRYEVKDLENGVIRFLCSSAEIIAIDPVGTLL